MTTNGTLILTRKDVAELLDLDACIAAVEQAFRLQAEGRALPAEVLGFHSRDGGFHVKAAGLNLSRPYVAVKTNANFSGNPKRHGLPAIQGIIGLYDGEKGSPLAVLDSMEITLLRTGAATAVAARYLAREDAHIATICGCGNQGRIQLSALARVRPIERAFAYDTDPEQQALFSREMTELLGIPVIPVSDPSGATAQSDICVACTPARKPYLTPEMISPGTFVAAVGADSSDKQELDERLLAGNKIVVDVLSQCAAIGDLHHALARGIAKEESVHAELHEVVAGSKPGRESAEEIIIFDSTGTALEDVAAAAAVYEKALAAGRGIRIDLG